MSASPALPTLLPWHVEQWRGIANAFNQQRLHHALLLQGPGGVGKSLFAQRAAAALLCESVIEAEQRPCGTCRSCILVCAGNHPDRLELAPKEESSAIDVEQVRTRISELSLTPHYAGRRVIVVNPADGLTHSSANTMLKTLEEPPGGVVFLLLSARPALLPATIRSRCSGIRFQAPTQEQGALWLHEQGFTDADAISTALHWHGGAPVAAQQSLQSTQATRCQELVHSIAAVVDGSVDAVQAAADWRTDGLKQIVSWQLRVAIQAMRIKVLGELSQHSLAMQAISSRLDLAQLGSICEELLELQNALERQLNPSEQLALEGLAVTWRDAALKVART